MAANHSDAKYAMPMYRRRLNCRIPEFSGRDCMGGGFSGPGRTEAKTQHVWTEKDSRMVSGSARSRFAQDDPRSLNEEELKRLTKETLVRIARDEALPYRSKMNKAQLARTLRKHFRQPT
jgi:phage gp16-like protein